MSGRGVCSNLNCRDPGCNTDSDNQYCTFIIPNSNRARPSSLQSRRSSPAILNNNRRHNQRSSDSSSSTSSSVSSGVDSVIPDRMRYPETRRDSDQASPEDEVVQTSDDTTQAQVQAQAQNGTTFVCTDPGCSDPNCGISQNSSRAPVCTHEGCNCDHSDPFSARNVMIGLTGLLMLLMVGYMAYMKRKPSRPKSNTFNGHIAENGMASVPFFVEKS